MKVCAAVLSFLTFSSTDESSDAFSVHSDDSLSGEEFANKEDSDDEKEGESTERIPVADVDSDRLEGLSDDHMVPELLSNEPVQGRDDALIEMQDLLQFSEYPAIIEVKEYLPGDHCLVRVRQNATSGIAECKMKWIQIASSPAAEKFYPPVSERNPQCISCHGS